MAISWEQMQALLEQQQKQFEKSQIRLIETLTEKLTLKKEESTSKDSSSRIEAAINAVSMFQYNPAAGVNFNAWYQKYEDVFKIEFSSVPDAQKIRLLLRKLDTAEHEKLSNFLLPKRPRDYDFDQIVEILMQLFGESSSMFNIRYNCLRLNKDAEMDWVTYTGMVNKECERSQFKKMSDDQFKCLVFAIGLRSPQLGDIRTRVLHKIEQNPDITLQSLLEDCQHVVNLKADAALIENQIPNNTSICAVNSRQNRTQTTEKAGLKPKTPCWFCGDLHFARNCTFRSHRCRKCLKIGHKEDCCRMNVQSRRNPRHQVRHFKHAKAITATFKIDGFNRRKYVNVSINGVPTRLQLDTASDITLISRNSWHKIGKPPFAQTERVAKNASGDHLYLAGEIECKVKFGDKEITTSCYLTEHPGLDLLGLDWMEQLQLLDKPVNVICSQLQVPTTAHSQKILELKSRHKEIFVQELGLCTKFEATLILHPDAKPVFKPKRPVPYAALSIVDAELSRLQSEGIIQPVNYSAWAAPIVVVKKQNGKVRICADFSTGLNNALENYEYPLPVPEDIFAKLNGGRCFAKIDLSDAYLQIPVSEDSQQLLTINTHKGLFQYTRLPFGVKIWQSLRKMIITFCSVKSCRIH